MRRFAFLFKPQWLVLYVVVIAFATGGGNGAGWHGALAGAPRGVAVWGALAVAFQSVIWTYYGSVEAAKIAEEIVEPERTLPRVFLLGIVVATALYLLLNAAFLHVLPFEQVAASNLVAGDVATAIFGANGGAVITVLALLVVLASLNGNVFVTPRVLFGLAGPAVLSYLTWETAKIRSTQSATGILYVDLFAVMVGEVLAKYLLLATRVPV